jgi:CBS domain-containing protein
MSVAAILRDKGNTIVSVLPDTPLMEIVATIASRRIGAVLVCSEPGELVGIVSERDVVKALAAKGSGLDALAARDVMTPGVTTVTLQTSINDAMELMDKGYFRHLPVLDQGTLVGIISVRDVVRARIDKHVEEAESMISYINSRV